MLEYDPYYFRGQEPYSYKPHLIAIEKKQKKTIHKKYEDIYKDFLICSSPLQISNEFRGLR